MTVKVVGYDFTRLSNSDILQIAHLLKNYELLVTRKEGNKMIRLDSWNIFNLENKLWEKEHCRLEKQNAGKLKKYLKKGLKQRLTYE